MKKERTPAQKLATYKRSLRDAWHRSPMYWSAYNRNKIEPGVIRCDECQKPTNSKLIEMDHVHPVCAVGQDPTNIALWAFRLNCESGQLRPLCEGCHGKKTSAENRKRGKK